MQYNVHANVNQLYFKLDDTKRAVYNTNEGPISRVKYHDTIEQKHNDMG